MDSSWKLDDLRSHFLATTTRSMPIAGMGFWTLVAVAGLYLKPGLVAYVVLFGSGLIFPCALLIDRLTSRKITRSSLVNPVQAMFMQCLGLVVLMWPLVITGAQVAHDPTLIVLGAAILLGIIWIPYGWAANDPVGLRHAVARCVLSYGAYWMTPKPYQATAVSAAVIVCYLYSLVRMRRQLPETSGS